jgi:PAS domain S-box-containing protein
MKYFHKKVWLGFITAIGIITWLGVNSYLNNRKSDLTSEWVAHTNRVLYHSEQILTLTVDFESGQRGYGLTGMPDFLEQANNAAALVDQHIESLRHLTSDNESQQQRVNQLSSLVQKKLKFSQLAIETRKNAGLEKVIELNASLRGKLLMDSIRNSLREFQAEEHALLDERTALTQKRIENFYASFATMLLATGVILLLTFYLIYVNLKRRSEAEQSLRAASDMIRDIYDHAPCGYHSLDENGVFIEINNTWLEWLQYTREEIVNKKKFKDLLTDYSKSVFDQTFPQFKKDGKVYDVTFEVIRKDGTTFIILLNSVALYDSDGKFVKSRSTALDYTQQKKSLEKIEQLNHELESFSYSVSHDLRAPLRSIDGYTQILLEDYSGSLDDEGKRVLNVVVNNARRMAKLIDDLLDFSRVGRKDVTKAVVNTEGMVHSIVSELKAQEQERDISISVGPLDPCDADPNLLRQVWFNLISNAIKYTRKRKTSVIEISSSKAPGEVVYKVRDNGTGFDMQYAHKLFGVFQRLHRQQEFEGTGVGLAIVHRIINRHGGRVWAEGEVDQGASFFFSLPDSIG